MWYGLKVSSLCARKRSRHPMATKNDTKTFLYIYDMLQKTFVESLFQFPWAYLAMHLRIVSRPKKNFKYFYDKKKNTFDNIFKSGFESSRKHFESFLFLRSTGEVFFKKKAL